MTDLVASTPTCPSIDPSYPLVAWPTVTVSHAPVSSVLMTPIDLI